MPLGTTLKDALRRTARSAGVVFHRLSLDDTRTYVELFGRESVEKRRFFNISGGGHFNFGCDIHHPCWTNVDLDRPWKGQPDNCRGIEYDPARGDIAHDLLSMEPLSIASGVAELVHSRVTIEHITDGAAQLFFREVHRILKPGGLFRVVAPNIELDFRALAARDARYFSWADPAKGITLERAFLGHFALSAAEGISDAELKHIFETMGREEALDHCVSRCSLEAHRRNRGGHINWWTPAKLQRALEAAGFGTVYLSAREQSASPVLRNLAYFDNVFERFMLFMEAVKV